ncbi:hypothetical protein DPMN_085184 [Dreissena polymorpha]|uniref:Uncharacterized protein n=1 Tax=Dreissena polymorpha TaxID=45954 RepID=A0A9D3YBX8_DREPO|nr:hypothetical protein DPMN_085184 [Dreissena polymorpha]
MVEHENIHSTGVAAASTDSDDDDAYERMAMRVLLKVGPVQPYLSTPQKPSVRTSIRNLQSRETTSIRGGSFRFGTSLKFRSSTLYARQLVPLNYPDTVWYHEALL